MLQLARKKGEKIIINGDIIIEILAVNGGKSVKIGISSPENVSILRGEVYERIRQENQQARAQKDSLMAALFSKTPDL